jgi:DnaJ-class molecular chaperone
MKDYYAILGVAGDSSTRRIKQAYKKLARKWHPDIHPEDPSCRTRMREINEAYEVLGNPAKRKAYDRRSQALRPVEPGGNGLYPQADEDPFSFYFRRMSSSLRKKAGD